MRDDGNGDAIEDDSEEFDEGDKDYSDDDDMSDGEDDENVSFNCYMINSQLFQLLDCKTHVILF